MRNRCNSQKKNNQEIVSKPEEMGTEGDHPFSSIICEDRNSKPFVTQGLARNLFAW